MSGRSVAFIEPAGSEANVFDRYMRLPLMGSLYLATILDREGYDVRIYNENIQSEPFDPYEVKADVFCLSALTVNANRARQLARQIRQIHPNARIVVGGIHASLVPGEFDEVADTIVLGEAESVIVDVIEGRVDEKIVHGAHVEDLDSLPLLNYGLLEGARTMSVVPIMTSRGCPFDCDFCTVTKVFGRRFRMQTPERVVAELENAFAFFGNRFFFFYDDNFTAKRSRIRRLCELIGQKGLRFDWTAQVRSDIARDPELVERMERAGCRRLFIGFESISDETLKSLHKSQTREDIETSIRVVRERGIGIHGMFMFGDEHDTPESIQATVDFAIHHHIDTVQFMILTPFPGTKHYEDIVAQDRLLHREWDRYDGVHTVFRPHQMSPARLERETLNAYLRFYSLARVSAEGLRLALEITLDALTWNFRRVFQYSFETIFLRAGGRFLVGRFKRGFDTYVRYLEGA